MSYRLALRPAPLRPASLAAVLAAHALLIGLLWLQSPGTRQTLPPTPLYVQFLAAADPAPTPVELPSPPPPRQVPPPPQSKPVPARPQVMTPEPSPAVIATPAPSATPSAAAPVAEATPAEAEASPAVAAPAAPAASSPPADAVTQPRYDLAYLSNPKPAYPSRSIELGEEGTVVLEAAVSAAGRVLSVRIKTSSGFPRLDRAALDAVRRWKFQPSRRGDTPVEGVAIIPMPFTLQNATP